MIKIYGSMMGSSGRCMWMAEEVGQAWEAIGVDLSKGENKTAEYLKLNPNGKIPVMVDGEFVIWESYAINTYLGEKYKPEMLGQGPEQHGLVNQWGYWGMANLAHAVEVLVVQKYRSTPDNDDTAQSHAGIARFLPILDGALAGKNYLVADTFTVADLNIASVIGALMWVGIDLTSYTNIQRWFGMISQRPAFQKTIGAK